MGDRVDGLRVYIEGSIDFSDEDYNFIMSNIKDENEDLQNFIYTIINNINHERASNISK